MSRSKKSNVSEPDSIAAHLVKNLDADLRRRVARDPADAARNDFKRALTEMDDFRQRGDGGSCDGFSFLDGDTIYYRPTWSDRQNFTIAHELAHLLVEEDTPAINWVGQQPDAAALEHLCDAIASRLLIPDELLHQLGNPPTAKKLALLHNTTSASRSACAVRVARRLPCAGFVAIIDTIDNTVFFAARNEDTYPYAWQGDAVPDAHHVRYVNDGSDERAESWWPYPNGERARYYLNAYREGNWTFTIFAELDLWQVSTFHTPDTPRTDRRPEHTLTCPSCRYAGTFHAYPCSECGKPQCPKCQRCDCDRRDERSVLCPGCGLLRLKAQMRDGLCNDCRD